MYVIIKKREFFGPEVRRSLVTDWQGNAIKFEKRSQAAAWIKEEDQGIYHLSHNEMCRATYRICQEQNLPARFKQQLWETGQ
jgi:hypothetical protein